MIKGEDKRAFLDVVEENFKIIRELSLTADEVRARFGLLPMAESKKILRTSVADSRQTSTVYTWSDNDLVPNPGE